MFTYTAVPGGSELQKLLFAFGSALTNSVTVGLNQAATILGGIPLLTTTRTMKYVNTHKREDLIGQAVIIDPVILNTMEGGEPAIPVKGPSSHTGRRDAYLSLTIQQATLPLYVHGELTFFAFLTSWTPKKLGKQKVRAPPLFTTDDAGFVTNGVSFAIGDLYFVYHKIKQVVHLHPYIPHNVNDEASAFSILLLHTPWPITGDVGLLGNSETAVQRLKIIMDSGIMPSYTAAMLDRIQASQDILNEAADGKKTKL
jgi:hypothetical protein